MGGISNKKKKGYINNMFNMRRMFKVGTAVFISGLVFMTGTACAAVAVESPAGANTPILYSTDITLMEQGFMLGSFSPNPVYGNVSKTDTDLLASKLNTEQKIVNMFVKWSGEYSTFDKLENKLTDVFNAGRIPLITWEAWAGNPSEKNTPINDTMLPSKIVAGEQDAYINKFAEDMKAYSDTNGGKDIYIRMNHEMNGDWYPWSSEGSELYKQSWDYVVDIFDSKGLTNVKWVWEPNNFDYNKTQNWEVKGTTVDDLKNWYPSADNVDVMALDVYNCTLVHKWKSFEDLTRPAYNELVKLSNVKPVWITETGTCEPTYVNKAGETVIVPGSEGQTKAGWFADMVNTRNMPQLEAIILFNQHNTARDYSWVVDTTPESLAGIKNAFSMVNGNSRMNNEGVVPSKVSNLSFTPEANGVKLSWTGDAEGYIVARDGVKEGFVLGNTFTDIRFLSGSAVYTVSGVKGGLVGASTEIIVNMSSPSAPLVSATGSMSSVTVKWNKVANAHYYNVFRNGVFIKSVAGNVNSFTDTYLKSDSKYIYTVKTVNKFKVSSGASNNATVWTSPAVPVNVKAVSNSKNLVTVSWSGNPTSSNTTYMVYNASTNTVIKNVKGVNSVTFSQGSGIKSYSVQAVSIASGIKLYSGKSSVVKVSVK